MKIRVSVLGILLVVLLLSASPAGASTAVEAKLKPGVYTIKAPRAGQTLSGVYFVRPRISGKRARRYDVTVKLDGRTIKRRRSASRRKALARIRLDTRRLANGHHRLTVTIGKRGKRARRSAARPARQSIRFRVLNVAAPPQQSPTTTSTVRQLDAVPPAPAGYKLEFFEDFSKDAAIGSWDPDSAAWGAPVYTGARGTQWTAYPSDYGDTWNKNPYRAKEVVSVHDGVLDFHLHAVEGPNRVKPAANEPATNEVQLLNAGASVSPILPSGSRYQVFGQYSLRLRMVGDLFEYHIASVLWPRLDSDYEESESDFPEVFLNTGPKVIDGYAHYGPTHDDQDSIHTARLYDLADWHTYTQRWTPIGNFYYIDDELVGQTAKYNWNQDLRWQIQTQTTEGFKLTANSGNLQVDWAAVWSPAPAGG